MVPAHSRCKVGGAHPDRCYYQCPPREVPVCRAGSCHWPRGPGFTASVMPRFHHLSLHPSFSGNVISFKVPLASRCNHESFGGENQRWGRSLDWPSEDRAWAWPPLTCSVSCSLSLPALGLSFPSCTAGGGGRAGHPPCPGRGLSVCHPVSNGLAPSL